jgi:hypothetical protein
MLIVQKFHSIHEIDPEFIPSLEILLQEEIPSFTSLIEKHDTAPACDVFTYFLFFGPTQNTPIGFAQLCLRTIPSDDLISWKKKYLQFWNKDHHHWKQLTWKVGDGHTGLYVIDPRFSKTGREKIQELIKEYEERSEIMAEEFFYLKGMQDFQSSWNCETKWTKDRFVLEPLAKSAKSYQDYVESMPMEMRKHIKKGWQDLHHKIDIQLGDYPSAKETPPTVPVEEKLIQLWDKMGCQILTFEKDLKVLGCLLVMKGKNGNVFFEPFPFESQGPESLVSDELYTQYALLKFFEMPEARKCHLLKFGSKLVFEDKEDLKFFQDQGFQYKTVTHSFSSKLPNLPDPL